MHHNSGVAKKITDVRSSLEDDPELGMSARGAEPVPTWPCMATVVNVNAPAAPENRGHHQPTAANMKTIQNEAELKI